MDVACFLKLKKLSDCGLVDGAGVGTTGSVFTGASLMSNRGFGLMGFLFGKVMTCSRKGSDQYKHCRMELQ